MTLVADKDGLLSTLKCLLDGKEVIPKNKQVKIETKEDGFYSQLVIEGCDESVGIYLTKLNVNEIIVKNANVKELIIENATVSKIQITDLTCSKIDIDNSAVNLELVINNYIEVKEYFDVRGDCFSKIRISGTLVGRIGIGFDTCETMEISDVRIKGELMLSCRHHVTNVSLMGFGCYSGKLVFHDFEPRIDVPSSITFERLSLGESEFIGSDFSAFSYFNIDRLQFQKATSYATKWPLLPIVVNTSKNKDTLTNYYYKIKEMHRNEGEKEEQFTFHVLENNSRLAGLKKRGSEWLSLLISKSFSEHGTNWIRPLTILFSLNLLLIPIMINLFNFIEFSLFDCSLIGGPLDDWRCSISTEKFTYNGWKIFDSTGTHFSFKDAFHFMNPLHKIKDIDFQGNTWFYMLDSFGRAFNGYLYFQIVKSFRKFVN